MNKIYSFFHENKTFVTLLIGCLCLLALFVGVATLSGSWPGSDASAQILSALAGAVVAAIITLFLLLGQTSSEEKKERNTKVFEEKLRIYQDFLHKLCDVIKDGRVTKEEACELKFQTAYITMHTQPERIKVISESVRKIIDTTIDSDDAEEGSTGKNDNLLKALFTIVEQFKAELYTDSTQTVENVDRLYGEAIDNFMSIAISDDDTKDVNPIVVKLTSDSTLPLARATQIPEQATESDQHEERYSMEQNIIDFIAELRKRIEPQKDRWTIETDYDTNDGIGCQLLLGGSDKVRVGIGYENEQHYFYVHIEHPEYYDTYQFIKWEFGGRQNKTIWWKWLDGNWKYLLKSQEFANRDWEQALRHIATRLNSLALWTERFWDLRTNVYLPLQDADKRAKLRMRKNYLVIFDYDDADRTFIDIRQKDESGEYLIRIGNREHNEEHLINKLKGMGYTVTSSDIDDEKRYTIQDNIKGGDIIEEVKGFIAKLKI